MASVSCIISRTVRGLSAPNFSPKRISTGASLTFAPRP